MTAPDLHSRDLLPGGWWACREPERPYDDDQVYDERCQRCIIKAQVDLAKHGDVVLFDFGDPLWRRPPKYMLSDLAAGRML